MPYFAALYALKCWTLLDPVPGSAIPVAPGAAAEDEDLKKPLPLQAQGAEADWQPPRVTSLRVVSASTPTLTRFEATPAWSGW